MAYAHDIRSIFSAPGFMCEIQAPIRIPFYSKPESGVHVTKMTCDLSMIITYVVVISLKIMN